MLWLVACRRIPMCLSLLLTRCDVIVFCTVMCPVAVGLAEAHPVLQRLMTQCVDEDVQEVRTLPTPDHTKDILTNIHRHRQNSLGRVRALLPPG